MGFGFGWVPDEPDSRDHIYTPSSYIIKSLPKSVDLRPNMPPVYNQLNLNSCTANAIAGGMEYDEIAQGVKPVFTPSRLFIYYNERVMEGKVSKDAGAGIRDGIKSIVRQGDCPEALWPYREAKFAKKPPEKCYRSARHYRAVEYERMNHNLAKLKSCLATGFPFVFGMRVFASFQCATVRRSGHLKMPKKNEKPIGLHAVLCAGYDDLNGWFIVRNSWGRDWGINGYFTIPYKYLVDTKLAHDFWKFKITR